MASAIILVAAISLAIAWGAQLVAQSQQEAEPAVVPIPVKVRERS